MAAYKHVAEVLAAEKPAVVVHRVYPRASSGCRAHALEERDFQQHRSGGN